MPQTGRFFSQELPDKPAIQRTGKQISRLATMIEIVNPRGAADKPDVVVREATDQDKKDFARAYKAFQMGFNDIAQLDAHERAVAEKAKEERDNQLAEAEAGASDKKAATKITSAKAAGQKPPEEPKAPETPPAG